MRYLAIRDGGALSAEIGSKKQKPTYALMSIMALVISLSSFVICWHNAFAVSFFVAQLSFPSIPKFDLLFAMSLASSCKVFSVWLHLRSSIASSSPLKFVFCNSREMMCMSWKRFFIVSMCWTSSSISFLAFLIVSAMLFSVDVTDMRMLIDSTAR